jgi:hypothetical protein
MTTSSAMHDTNSKWNSYTPTSNQVNQTFNSVSAAVPQETKDFMKSAKEKIFDSDKLRSFSLFFGIGEETGFLPTIKPNILIPRVKNNILFFYLNYVLLASIILVITLFATMLNPKTLVMLAMLAISWLLVIKFTSGNGLEVGSFTISRANATTAMMLVSAIVLFFVVKDVFYVTLGSSAAFSLVHAILRDDSKFSVDEGAAAGDYIADVPVL